MTTRSTTRRGHLQVRIAAGVLTLIFVVLLASLPGVAAGVEASTVPPGAVTTESDTTVADQTTTPPTEPSGPTESSLSTVTVSPAAPSTSDSADTDDGSNTAITVVGVIAALGVLLLAVWWMLRRTDEPRPPTDPDWPDRSEVI